MKKKHVRMFWLVIGSVMVVAMLLFTILPGLQAGGNGAPL